MQFEWVEKGDGGRGRASGSGRETKMTAEETAFACRSMCVRP